MIMKQEIFLIFHYEKDIKFVYGLKVTKFNLLICFSLKNDPIIINYDYNTNYKQTVY